MEEVTTFGTPSKSQASLDTMPLEILNQIFVLTCSEDLDLSLLRVSRGMAWKLLNHPISRTVRAFWPVKQGVRNSGQKPTTLSWLSAEFDGTCRLPCYIDDRQRVQEQVLESAWCTSAFKRRLQVAFIRRMMTEVWDPFLERDGLKKCATSHPHFWDILDRLAQDDLRTAEKNLEIGLTDNETRYSWTRVRIWPWQGRIVIRDQLLNRSFEKTIQFLEGRLIDRRGRDGKGFPEIAV